MGLLKIVFISLVLALLLSMIAGAWFLYSGTKNKTKWGLNKEPIVCPKCGVQLPQIRKPKNKEQALWGGNSCEQCNNDVDKWGRELPSS